MLKTHVFASAKDDRIVGCLVCFAGCTAIEAQGAVQQGAIPLLHRVQLLDEVCVHFVQESNVLGNIRVVLLFMRQFV